MPFDEEDDKDFIPKIGVKTSGKSMFENKPKPPTQQEFQNQVQKSQDAASGYKNRAADLFIQFNKAMADKTLKQNRNMLSIEYEKEMLQNMLQLAVEINRDPNEQEGMGSLTWITLLFKTCLAQRDRLNDMEYALIMLQKKIDTLSNVIKSEVKSALDNSKPNE